MIRSVLLRIFTRLPCVALLILLVGISTQCQKIEHEPYLESKLDSDLHFKATLRMPGRPAIEGTSVTASRGVARINGVTYDKSVSITSFPDFDMPEFVTYSRMTEEGVYTRDSADVGELEVLAAPLPIKIGKSWPATIDGFEGKRSYEAIEDITVNGKTYADCLKTRFESNNGKVSIEVFVAPHFDVVFVETTTPQGTLIFERVVE